MRSIRRALCLTLLAAGPAVAQAPDPASVRAQLSRVGSTAELRRIEREHASSALPAVDALTAGFAALRLADITGDRDHAQRARRYFDRVAGREPQNAWAHYGHALSFSLDIAHVPSATELVLGDNALAMLGLDARARARRALERAVAIDPTLPGAITLLARYAADTRDRPALEQVRAVLTARQLDGFATDDDIVSLAETLRHLDEHDAAIDVMRAATVGRADAPAPLLLELTRALVHRPDNATGAGTAYLRAVAAADDSLLALLWRDVEVIARATEATQWQTGDLAARRALLERFWNVRAALAGVSPEERIAEHYRRVDYAAEHFRRFGRYGAPSTNSLVLGRIDDDYDDRGVIYIRHGQPLDVVRRTSSFLDMGRHPTRVPWESWAYRDDAGETVMFHFAKFPPSYTEPNAAEPGRPLRAGGSSDFVLVANVDCGVVDEQHIQYDRRLTTLALRCNAVERRAVSAVIRRDARTALRTESFRPALDVALPFYYDHYAFRGTQGRTLLVAAVGLPLARLDRERALRVALTIADTASGALDRTEAVTPTVAPTADAAQLLRTHVSMELAPREDQVYRIAVADAADPRAGMMYGGPLHIPDFRGDTLMLSDVVLAEPAPEGNFTRGNHSFALAPSQLFARAEFRLFYEIYNIAPDTKYRTEITVAPVDAGLRGTIRRLFGKEAPIVLAFDAVTPLEMSDRMIQEVRTVRASLPAGRYKLKISLKADGARRALVRERAFTIGNSP